MQLVSEGVFGSGADRFDYDLRDLEVFQSGGRIWLYAASGPNGGLSLYELEAGAEPVLADTRDHTGANLATGSFTQTGSWLIQEDTTASQLSYYDMDGTGALQGQLSLALPGTAIGGLGDLAAAPLDGGGSAVYAIARSGGTLQGWRLDNGGSVAGPAAMSGPEAAFARPQATDMAVSGSALLVADAAIGGLASFAVSSADGTLSPVQEIGSSEGLSVSGPMILATLEAYGRSWAVLAAQGSSSLSAFQVSSGGGLDTTAHVTDTLATRFGGVSSVKMLMAEQHAFVLAAGGDDGLTVFRLLPDGRLLHVSSLPHTSGAGLQDVTAIETVLSGGELQIFTAGAATGGIGRFTAATAHLGDVLQASGSAGQRLQGTARADLITGGSGADTLEGGDGNDIIALGAGGGEMTGGAGQDIFAVQPLDDPSADTAIITDFTPGEDILDLSAFTALRGPGQLDITESSTGAVLRFAGHEITLFRAGGGALTAADIWGASFSYPDSWDPGLFLDSGTLFGGVDADALAGTGGADSIDGLDGDDTISGGGGADTLIGRHGTDSLTGGEGADILQGGVGNDILLGGSGGDSLDGGTGQDRLQGGDGADSLHGGSGGDTLSGGNGSDWLAGDAGNDSLSGGSDADWLYGGTGADVLDGGTGSDVLHGARGQDSLDGGAGDDILRGKREHDVLEGGDGADTLIGGAGRDAMDGGSGNDVLSGKKQADLLRGGSGNDSLSGGNGKDLLAGGSGDDWLDGGAGRDTLSGEGGADTFVFTGSHGRDQISDFTPGEDLIDLSALDPGAADSFAGLTLLGSGSDVAVQTGAGRILLLGLSLQDIGENDFIF